MIYVFRERDKKWKGPYEFSIASGKEVYVLITEVQKHFNISQILPYRSEHQDGELQSLLTSIEQFNTDLPPSIFLTKVLDPSDCRKSLPQFDLAKTKELEGLALRGVFEIVAKDEDLPMEMYWEVDLSYRSRTKRPTRKCTRPDMLFKAIEMQKK